MSQNKKISTMDIQKKAYELMSVLYSKTTIKDEEYSVLLYLITLCDQGLIHENNIDFSISKLKTNQFFNQSEHVELESYFDYFSPSIDKIDDKSILEILLSITEIKSVKDGLKILFDETLYLFNVSNKIGVLNTTPKDILSLMKGLVPVKDNIKIYNPFAGTGSFAFMYEESAKYLGQELTYDTWVAGRLRLIVNRTGNNIQLKNDDSINNWPSDEAFDLVITIPPFRLIMPKNSLTDEKTYRYIENFALMNSLNLLEKGGKVIMLMSPYFLNGSHVETAEVRNYIIENDFLERVILLPHSSFSNTRIQTIILELNSDKKEKNVVTLVDGTTFVSERDKIRNVLDYQKLLSAIDSSSQEFVKKVKNEELKKDNFRIHIKKFFLPEELINEDKADDYITLRDVLTPVKRDTKDFPEKGKVVGINDLSDDKYTFKLDVETLESKDLARGLNKVKKSSVLVSLVGAKIRAVYFEKKESEIYCSHSIEAYKIDEEKVLPEYLVHELYEEYVQQQVSVYQLGGAYGRINKEGFLNVKIKKLSTDEQKIKLDAITEISNKIDFLENERAKYTRSEGKKSFDEFAALKHTLGRPRLVISSAAFRLHRFFEKHPEQTKEINQLFGDDILQVIGRIRSEINFITEILERGEQGIVLSKYPLSFISLNEVFREINSYKAIDNHKFNIEVKNDIKNSDKMSVLINNLLLKTLLDNLMTNADKHGFESKKEGNKMLIHFREEDGSLVMEVLNNGNPFPKNMDKENFITKYKTTDNQQGSGIGGYDINKIAKYFNDKEWELILNENPLYPVNFKFHFEIINN